MSFTSHPALFERHTEQQLENIAKEFATACFHELYNKDPEAPAMTLTVPGERAKADFLVDLNQERVGEHEWIVLFNDMVAPYVYEPLRNSQPVYRPTDAEHRWASKIAVAVKNGRLETARSLLEDGTPNDSVFSVRTDISAEQPVPFSQDDSTSANTSPVKSRSIRGEISVPYESHFIEISIGPSAEFARIRILGYTRLVNALVCWFILR